jgi:hypothetical protein
MAQVAPPRIFSWSETLRLEEEMVMRSPIAVTAIGETGLAVAEVVPVPRVLEFRRSDARWSTVREVPLPAAPVDLVHDGKRLVIALREPGGMVSLGDGDEDVQRLALDREIVPGHLSPVRNGNLLVHDLASDRVVELNADLQLVREAEVPLGVTALVATPGGGFLIALGAEGRVVRYDSGWALRDSWDLAPDDGKPAWPAGIVALANGEILVLDRHGSRILALDSNGRWVGLGSRRGWDPGLLWFPADLTSLHRGFVAVADEGNGRVQIFRRTSGGDGAE